MLAGGISAADRQSGDFGVPTPELERSQQAVRTAKCGCKRLPHCVPLYPDCLPADGISAADW